MSPTRFRSVTTTVVGALLVTTLAASTTALASTAVRSPRAVTLPQRRAARAAATWLAAQVTTKGYIASSGSPDLSDTAQAVLALAAAGNEHAVALRALTYLKGHVDAYVTEDGTDGPGELATLILAAHALGVSPTRFGTTDLVARLLKTARTSGADAGLFGAQDPTYDGAYRQGLALAALGAVGIRTGGAVTRGISWLQRQQCSDGGWEAYRASTTPCTPTDGATYSGPDTNSTALAVEGLKAEHAVLHHKLTVFYRALQSANGGWGYYGGAQDPDSTSLVIQALLSMHVTVSSTDFERGAKDPVSAVLSFQLASGALYYPESGSPKTASLLATEQAIPALASKALPF